MTGMVTIGVPKTHYEETAKEHFFLVLDSGSKSPENALLQMAD